MLAGQMDGHSNQAKCWQKCGTALQTAPAEVVTAAGNVSYSLGSQYGGTHICVRTFIQVASMRLRIEHEFEMLLLAA